ncbi:MAG: fumarylacetoacetate hydrolase family protein [Paracoccus denitrificans]|uniref:Fumarylacetoacetate hydrolase family protein n=1 Tax=Paracoccus denitrificans TaxID=266 RepID=A0A533IBU2_PARDE|nr:MAG: fumarylacetoacetate hydrolase family protein [Paracoccus denitrificans]
MTDTLFPAPQWPTVAVNGKTARFPVRRIFCVGRNYAAHAAEMGVEVDREAPFYFTKSALTILPSGQEYPYPPGTENFHYEMELVVAIGKPAFRVSADQAMDAVYGYATGLDMTRRDLQLVARSKQRPWDLGKDVEGSAVISAITPATEFTVADQPIRLSVGGEVKQDATLADLVWSVPELVADLSKFYHLQPGDLIYTGTPAGVGAVLPGDVIHGTIDGLDPVELKVGSPE